jgi:hypothetical protein
LLVHDASLFSDVVERIQDFVFILAITIQNVSHLGFENSGPWLTSMVRPVFPFFVFFFFSEVDSSFCMFLSLIAGNLPVDDAL